MTVRDVAQLSYFVDAVERAKVGRLGDVQRKWLHARRIAAACQLQC